MNTMITDAALPPLPEMGYSTLQRGMGDMYEVRVAYTARQMQDYARAALEAALPHLAAPEAGNPVSVSERERFEEWASENIEWQDDVGPFSLERSGLRYVWPPMQYAWQAWQAAFVAGASSAVGGKVLVNMGDSEAEFIRAGDEEAARQPLCSNCNGVGVIPYTIGQTPESFEQGEYPCPDCADRQSAVDVEDVLGKALDMAKAGAGAVGLVEWITEQLIKEEE